MSKEDGLARARKDHRCDCCGDKIEIGCIYYAQDVRPWECGDGDKIFFTWRAHTECKSIYDEMDERGIVDPYEEFVDLPSDWSYLLKELEDAKQGVAQ